MKKIGLILALVFTGFGAYADFDLASNVEPDVTIVVPCIPGFPVIPGFNFPGCKPQNQQGRNRACFYADVNYTGDAFCVNANASRADLIRSGWNDRVSSVLIQGRTSVTLYSDVNYGGRTLTLNRSVADLRTHGMFNDEVSSLRVKRGGKGMPKQGQVCFYSDVNYQGNSFCLNTGDEQATMNSSWNDMISSIKITGDASVYVYKDFNYSGGNLFVNRSMPDLRTHGGGWNDTISSVNILHADGQP